MVVSQVLPDVSNKESPASAQVVQRAMHVLHCRNPGVPEDTEYTVRESDTGVCWTIVGAGSDATAPLRDIPTTDTLPVCCLLPADSSIERELPGVPQCPGNVVGPREPVTRVFVPLVLEIVDLAG